MHKIAYITACLTMIAIITGCGKKEDSQPTPPPHKSTMTTFAEGITGKTYVDAGERAKKQIKAISQDKNQNLDEVLGE